MKIWRNDKKPDMSATPSTVVPVAEDILAEDLDGYSVKIVHVFAWFGRGFMPSVYFYGKHAGNGDVFYGEDEVAYKFALENGLSLTELIKQEEDNRYARLYMEREIAR